MTRTLLAAALLGCTAPPTSSSTTTDEGAKTDRPTSKAPSGDTGVATTVAADCGGTPGASVTVDGISVAYRMTDADFVLFRYTYTGAFDLVGEFSPDKPPLNGLTVRYTRWDQPVSSGQRVPFGTTEFPTGDVRTVGVLAASVAASSIYYNQADDDVVEGSLDLLCFDEAEQTVTVAWEGFARSIGAPTVDVPFSGRLTHVPVEVVDIEL